MLPTLRCRPIRTGDAAVCARWLADDCATPANGSLELAISRLIGEERIKGAVVESYDGDGSNWTIQGIGLSGFAHSEAVDRHLARPKPFMFVDFVERSARGEPRHFLDPDNQARHNASAGIGMDLVAHWMQRSWNLADPHWHPRYVMAHENFIKEHRGFRITRMLHEDWTRPVDIYLTLGYRAHSTFAIPTFNSSPNVLQQSSTRILYCMDRNEIRSHAPGSAASYLLQYVEPICHFTRAEQRLLRKALEGLTDHQIASDLGLSLNTLKSTWRSIYERMALHAPYVLAATNGDSDDSGVRGTEKRRSVLSFVENNPQELRPYARP